MMKKRNLIALILVLCLVVGLMPARSVYAEGNTDQGEIATPTEAEEAEDTVSANDTETAPDTSTVQAGNTIGAPADETNVENNNNDPVVDDKLRIRIEGTRVDNTGSTFSFTYNEQDTVNATLNGGDIEDCNDHFEWAILRDALGNASVTVPADFDKDKLHIILRGPDNYQSECAVNGTTATLPGDIPNGCSISIEENGGGQPAEPMTRAQINLSGPAGSWTGDPMVREEYPQNEDGTCTIPYSRNAYVVRVNINGGDNTRCVSHYGFPEEGATPDKYQETFGSQIVNYPESEGETVTLNFNTNWGNKIESISINGTNYPVPLNYNSRNNWLKALNRQEVSFAIENVPLGKEIDDPEGGKIRKYDIVLQVRPITEEECYIGNFLWASKENPAEDDDMSIGHSYLTLLSVEYDDGTGKHKLDLTDPNVVLPSFIQFNVHVEEETGIECGEMVVPEGSWVTMRIVPKYGYQVDSFNVNGDSMKLGGVSEFSFLVKKGNFHLSANVIEQEDEVKINTNGIENASLELAEGTLDTGTARLSVSDVDLSDEKKAAFAQFASGNSLTLGQTFDITLYQVFFKGQGNSDDVWAFDMEELNDPAYIYFLLPNGIDLENLYIVHNIHNGDEFELIKPEIIEIDGMKIVKFPADSFSTYALAEGSAETVPDDNSKKTDTTGSKTDKQNKTSTTAKQTGDETPIAIFVTLMILSIVGITFIIRKKESRKQ